MVQRSLFARLTLVLTIVLGIGVAVLTVAAWFYARLAADEAYDRLLIGAALQIAETIAVQGGRVTVEPPFAAFETLALSPNDRIFYKVTAPDGSVLTGADDVPSPASPERVARGAVIVDGRYHRWPVRIVTVGHYVPDPAVQGMATVVIAQTTEARASLARDLTVKALALVGAMSALAFLSVVFAVSRALTPLTDIERILRAREPNDLTPLQVDAPAELQVLLSSMNYFMERLAGRIGLMKRFIADAAHQIRTPLTALVSQVDLLSSETDDTRRARQLSRLQERTSELARLTNQLLSHAMVIHRAGVVALASVDLVPLARRALTDAVPLSLDREIDIKFGAEVEHAVMQGDPVSLREALVNIISNAVKHGATSLLRIRVSATDERVSVEVIDDGPGIPVSDWKSVREPFNTRAEAGSGSGLGLAIAAEVVRAHEGELQFRERSNEGFAVILSFARRGPEDRPDDSSQPEEKR